MNKMHRFCFLIILITFIGVPGMSQNRTCRFCLVGGNEIIVTMSCDTPFSIPQNSNSNPNQPIEEDAGDDDDQDKKLEHSSHFYVDPNSSMLSQFHLAFKEQHHEVVTPPPQS